MGKHKAGINLGNKIAFLKKRKLKLGGFKKLQDFRLSSQQLRIRTEEKKMYFFFVGDSRPNQFKILQK